MGKTWNDPASNAEICDTMLTMPTKMPILGSTNPPPTAVTDNSKSKKSDGVLGGQPVRAVVACKWPECRKWHCAFQEIYLAKHKPM